MTRIQKERDKFCFKIFLSQFENCIADIKSKSTKLQYLSGYLADYALKIIQHLSISDENYNTALAVLKNEFLDKDIMIRENRNEISEAKPYFNSDVINIRKYLTKIPADLSDLKDSYGMDFQLEGSPRKVYMSNRIFAKLPNSLKKALIHVTSTN